MAADPHPAPMGAGSPLRLRYEWVEASIPPPYHYEWTLEIQGQQGQLTFYPDYPQHGVSAWVRVFPVPQETLQLLYAVMENSRVYRANWQTPAHDTVGGAQDFLTVWRNGQTYQVPARRTGRANQELEPVWKAVRACVPQTVWDEIFALRESAIQSGER